MAKKLLTSEPSGSLKQLKMKSILLLILTIGAFLPLDVFSQTTTYNTAGTFVFTVPAGVTSITVECWGGGGTGGGGTAPNIKGGGGGAGGAYARSILPVTPYTSYTVTVAAAMTGGFGAGLQGNSSWFGTTGTVFAEGGAGGAAANNTTVSGGIGSAAASIGNVTTIAGASGSNGTTTVGGAGGAGANSGGAGGAQRTGTENNGNSGTAPGGGGSGGLILDGTDHSGGNGASGQVVVTYTLPGSPTTYFSKTSGSWNLASTWTTSPSHTGANAGPPVAGDAVVIGDTHTVGTNNGSRACLDLAINGSGALNINQNGNTVTVSGNFKMDGTSQITGNGATRTVSVGGAFTVPATATNASISGQTVSITGTTTIDGTLILNNGTGTKTFGNTVTVNAGGVWDASSGNPATSFGGGITMNGTTFNNGTGAAAFSATQSLLGSSDMTFGGTVTPAAATTLTNSNTGTVTIGSITLTGNFTQNTNATLALTATTPVSGAGTFDASSNANTVNYTGAAQTLGAVAYSTLGLSGSGTKTMTGVTTIGADFNVGGTASATAAAALTIGGNVTLSSGTFDAGTFTHNIAGNWINSGSTVTASSSTINIAGDWTISGGTFTASSGMINLAGNWTNNGGTFTASSSTVNFTGSGQTIGGSSSTTFNKLALTGSGTTTLSSAIVVYDNLSIASGALINPGTITTHQAGTITLGGVLQSMGSWGSTSSAATNKNNTYFTAGTTGIINVNGRTFYSIASTAWNLNTSWSFVSGGTAVGAGEFPIAGDNVIIENGNSVNLTANAACSSLSFNQGTSATTTLSFNAGITLNVSGAITIPLPSGGFGGRTNSLNVGAGILNASSLAFTNAATFGSFNSHELDISTGTVTISGDVTQDAATTVFPSPSVTFSGAGTLNLGGAFLTAATCNFTASTGTVDYYGNVAQTIGDFTYYNLTLAGSGTKTMAGSANIGGNWINNTATAATFDPASSTISFNAAGAQSIGGSVSTTFFDLILAGSGTKSLNLTTTISDLLTINSGVVCNPGSSPTIHTAGALNLAGTGQTNGTWGSTSSTATNQNDTYFTAGTTGIVNVTGRIFYSIATANWDVNTTWSFSSGGAAVGAGIFPTASDIVVVENGNNVTVAVNANCSTLQFNANTSTSTTLSINSGITLNVSKSVIIPETGIFSGDVNTLAVGAGILNTKNLAFTQSSFAVVGQYHRLTISTGVATITGNVTTDGGSGYNSPTITFTGTGTLHVAGSFLNSETCTFTRGTGTVDYNGVVAQTVGDLHYYNLTLNNTFGTIPQLTISNAGSAAAVDNLLTMTSGVVNLNGTTFTHGVSGTASTLTRTGSTTTNWMYGGTFRRFWPVAAITTTGNSYGLFPVGSSTASSYRPVAITSSVNPTGTGSFSVTHTNATTSTDLSPVYNDGGTNIVRKHDSQFVTATTAAGGSYGITVTMTDLAAGTLSDIRLAVSNGATTVTDFGSHTLATGSAPNPTAGRLGPISLANLVGDWRITTTNSSATPLPIELMTFTGEAKKYGIELQWETASELNNDFFTVLGSATGANFEAIGTVNGNGTTSTPHSYSLTDYKPVIGKNYYQLKQTDFDGHVTTSETIVVNVLSLEPMTSVYPNPLSQNQLLNVVINGLAASTSTEIQIANLQGTKVFGAFAITDADGALKAEIALTGLSAGLYILNVQNVHYKFIIE